jgi:transposase-like protein
MTSKLPVDVRRWTPKRKLAVILAVAVGEITFEELAARYRMSAEEFRSWQRDYEDHGEVGLHASRLQHYGLKRIRRSGRKRKPA